MYKLTWVGWLNIIVLQWFFFRLAYHVHTETGEKHRFFLLYPILPLTGWFSQYVCLFTRKPKRKFLRD